MILVASSSGAPAGHRRRGATGHGRPWRCPGAPSCGARGWREGRQAARHGVRAANPPVCRAHFSFTQQNDPQKAAENRNRKATSRFLTFVRTSIYNEVLQLYWDSTDFLSLFVWFGCLRLIVSTILVRLRNIMTTAYLRAKYSPPGPQSKELGIKSYQLGAELGIRGRDLGFAACCAERLLPLSAALVA